MFWLSLFCVILLVLWLYARSRPAPSSLLDLPHKDGPLVIAHGDEAGGGLYPGNTLLHLQKMTELGVDAVELDLSLTADGHLVLMHDNRVDRTTDGRGSVADMTLAELRELNVAHNWSRDGENYPYRRQPLRIATIDEVFAALPEIPVIIELKNNDVKAARALCDSIRRFGRQDRVIVSSFHQKVIGDFRRLCPEVATGAAVADALLFYAAQLLHLERLLSLRYQTMQLPMRYYGIRVFSPRFLHAARKCNLHLSVWTVNDIADMQHYIDLGVDGIVTDRPDILRSLLRERETSGGR
ncbi:glycerophosphodiester phosphodiesterase [Microbulbifer rhizosphaerae]|uniref:Glycerophosphoryl diester phosphodiesterase n=1 Tax=Microbulbifer rhizosphaerae TaxID=1562603 RepID=A0A7W4W9V1_9GAMM|nr:glycerophosphodiester phosphodiesterase [Microbulbifer rhizosphaerae]MBB3059676.1 glycerophosphoryl diester phosphodiesterase [Microbulbifer rhizosphaerae]